MLNMINEPKLNTYPCSAMIRVNKQSTINMWSFEDKIVRVMNWKNYYNSLYLQIEATLITDLKKSNFITYD